MSSPVQLSDLDLATTADDADLALIRKSDTTDYKVTVAVLRNIAVASLPNLPSNAQLTDYMLINQAGSNCKIEFGKVGFLVGTKMWFFTGAAPNVYWEIEPGTGDTLLAVKGSGGTYSTGGNVQGAWQQQDATLSISQIPAHTHTLTKTKDNTGTSNNLGPVRGKHVEDDVNPNFRVCTTNSTGGGAGHNHGNTWRPLASVGVICIKVG